LTPDVIAGQMNVFPAERRELLQQGVIDGLATIRDGLNRPLQIHGIPSHHGQTARGRAINRTMTAAIIRAE